MKLPQELQVQIANALMHLLLQRGDRLSYHTAQHAGLHLRHEL